MLVKTGNLYKKGAGGPGLFQRQNWKPRCFKLTHDALYYYDYNSGTLKGTIDLSSCKDDGAVHVLARDCAKKTKASAWRFAIDTPTRRWFFAADTEADMLAWTAAIRQVIQLQKKASPAIKEATPVDKPARLAPIHPSTTGPCA
ncbi:unnamed protein product [Aphanomyces euteiches]|uniref:PH domain-containing protein n=1 Tax=Aphanomyces euteiches TaxID=100861 RepID=A0A6G0W8V5_9STRA|nr:hypothetical protein Ae201684_017567 [Aphanomyces euteiches]KAH9068552.1 hypothetical protein Ae201684P_004257 [Aphanomyces euteiches]KAH9135354.1 hypothetical protein AeRB84_019201 [Aphanomyces euteiches]